MRPDEVYWLAVEDIVAFHDAQLSLFGGATGVLNEGQLLAAVSAPEMVLAYQPDADLFDLAAAYAYHLCQAHAFVDGNKRTAFLATLTFRQVNGRLIPDEAGAPVGELILALASGRAGRAEAAVALRLIFTG